MGDDDVMATEQELANALGYPVYTVTHIISRCGPAIRTEQAEDGETLVSVTDFVQTTNVQADEWLVETVKMLVVSSREFGGFPSMV